MGSRNGTGRSESSARLRTGDFSTRPTSEATTVTYISAKQLKAHTALLELSRASMLADGAPMIAVDHKHQIDPRNGNLKTFLECHQFILRFSIPKDAESISDTRLNEIPTDKLKIKFVPGPDGLTTKLQINRTIIEGPSDLESILNDVYSKMK